MPASVSLSGIFQTSGDSWRADVPRCPLHPPASHQPVVPPQTPGGGPTGFPRRRGAKGLRDPVGSHSYTVPRPLYPRAGCCSRGPVCPCRLLWEPSFPGELCSFWKPHSQGGVCPPQSTERGLNVSLVTGDTADQRPSPHRASVYCTLPALAHP